MAVVVVRCHIVAILGSGFVCVLLLEFQMASDQSDINHYVQSVSFLMQEKNNINGKLSLADAKLLRLENILKKKSAKSMHLSHPLRPDEATKTSSGMAVADFRLAQRSSKVDRASSATKSRGPEPLEKERCESMSLELIHHRHLQRTVCKREVSKRLQSIEDEKARKEKRSQGRKLPQLKVPESMLPNRYLRGELPCNIEHGTKGHYLSWVCPLENLDYVYYLPVFFDGMLFSFSSCVVCNSLCRYVSFSGLQCKEAPITFLARQVRICTVLCTILFDLYLCCFLTRDCFVMLQGIEDLLFAAKGHPDRVIPCVQSIVRPMRNALSKFDVELLLAVLKVHTCCLLQSC